KLSLVDTAEDWKNGYETQNPDADAAAFLTAFKAEYTNDDRVRRLEDQLTNKLQRQDQTIQQHANEVFKLLMLIDPTASEPKIITETTKGMMPKYKRALTKMGCKDLKTMKENIKTLDGLYFNGVNPDDTETIMKINKIVAKDKISNVENAMTGISAHRWNQVYKPYKDEEIQGKLIQQLKDAESKIEALTKMMNNNCKVINKDKKPSESINVGQMESQSGE